MNNDLSKKKEENLYTYPELAKLLNVTVGRLRTAKSIINDSLELNKHYFYATIKAGSPQMIQWTKLGAILLANRIRTPESSIFLEKLGIKERHRSRIEHDAIGVIVHAIQGYAKFKKQFFVYQFKVDLYLPEQKIVIECDEKDHKGYDKSYEEFSRNRDR